MSFLNDDEDNKIVPVMVIPNSAFFRQSGGQLMVAMQPGVDVPALDVEEVVVVTEAGEEIVAEDGSEDQDDMDIGYDDGSEFGAAEIEVAEVTHGIADILTAVNKNRSDRARTKSRKTKYRRRGRPLLKKSPVKIVKKQTQISQDFDDSESDIYESSFGGRSLEKPRKREFAHRLQWSDKNMKEAMKSVEDKKNTIRGAAKKFNVPYSTLKDRVRGRVRHGTKPGVKTRLSPEEEEELVKCIKQMEASGFQLHHINIRERAGELLSLSRAYNTSNHNVIPGHNWLAGFMKRHPDISKTRSVNRPVAPNPAKQRQILKKFFDTASCAYRKLQANFQTTQLYTMTELQINAFPHTSIIIAAAANGSILPPYIVFSGSQSLSRQLKQIFPSAFFDIGSNSRVREDIILSWFRDHFLRQVNPCSAYPVVLFVSQPVSNISVSLLQTANDRSVSFVCIPSGISHLVQPLSESVLNELDKAVSKFGRQWMEENKKTAIDSFGMAKILHNVWQKDLLTLEIMTNFEENGLFPLNSRAISHERIMSTSTHADLLKVPPLSPDNETNGLALLSELSSTEYASMDNHTYGGDELVAEELKCFSGKRKRDIIDDHCFEMLPSKQRRKNPAEKLHLDTRSFTRSSPNDRDRHCVGPKMSQELIRHVIGDDDSEASCSRTRPAQRVTGRRYPNLHQEIAAARTNPEQLNCAINSIIEENSKSTFLTSQRFSSSRVSGTTSANQHHHRQFSGVATSPPGKRLAKVNAVTAEPRMSKFVTLTPVRHVVEVSPNVKQEYISYVEEANAISYVDDTNVIQEFVPQEMVEKQTIIQDYMAYELSSDPFKTEEVIEEVIVDLPDLTLPVEETVLPVEETVVGDAEVKIENESACMNNNELTYDLQSGADLETHDGFDMVSLPKMQAIELSDLKAVNPEDKVKLVKFIRLNGQSIQIIKTVTFQELLSANMGSIELSTAPHTSGIAVGSNEMPGVDHEVSAVGDQGNFL